MRNAAVAARRALARLRREPSRPTGPSTTLDQPAPALPPVPERAPNPADGLAAEAALQPPQSLKFPCQDDADPATEDRARRAGSRRRGGLARALRAPKVVRDVVAARTGRGRLLPAAVTCLLLIVSLLGGAPRAELSARTGGVMGAVSGAGSAPRIAIAGLEAQDPGVAGVDSPDSDGAAGLVGDGPGPTGGLTAAEQWAVSQAAVAGGTRPGNGTWVDGYQSGPFIEGGTLLRPLAVNTTVSDGGQSLVTYVVRAGDTLTAIANRYGVSMMTIWWANEPQLGSGLRAGQKLVIPPVTGLLIRVARGDTVESIAADAKVSPTTIMSYNHVSEATLQVGQTLIVPGGVGDPMPTPSPTPAPTARPTPASVGFTQTTNVAPTRGSGRFVWPVVGGGNYISQYFHASHQAIDIAAQYGTPVVAAASGIVIFAGWKDNGGGYQVWISHGGNLYTDYNHMSALTVGTGERVGAGQQVGRIGATGDATGPHLHFDVWIGMIWGSGSYRVNPLNYF